jgi:hypothetical protein
MRRGARNALARSAQWREARGDGTTVALELGRSAMAVVCSGDEGRWGKRCSRLAGRWRSLRWWWFGVRRLLEIGTTVAKLELAAAIHGNSSHGGVEGVRVSGKRGMSGGRAWASAREEARRRYAHPSGGGVASCMVDTPMPRVAR